MHADAMHWGATSIEQNKASVWSKLRIPAKHINTVKPGNSLYKVKSSSPLHRLAQCRLQGHLTSIAESTQPVDSNERYENRGLNHFPKHKIKFHYHCNLLSILSDTYLRAEEWAALGAVLGRQKPQLILFTMVLPVWQGKRVITLLHSYFQTVRGWKIDTFLQAPNTLATALKSLETIVTLN